MPETRVRKGGGAGFFCKREDYVWIGGNDPLFAPASYDDMDLFIRMQLEGYDRQTAIDDVVNTEESNDPDDVAQWRSWIDRANRIVDPIAEDVHGEEEAQIGAQQRAENEILVAQKEDGAVPSLRERAIGASKEGSSKEDEQLVMDRLNNQ